MKIYSFLSRKMCFFCDARENVLLHFFPKEKRGEKGKEHFDSKVLHTILCIFFCEGIFFL